VLSPQAKTAQRVTFEKTPSSSDIWLHLKKDYKLVKFLGEGSFGQVKLGQCRVTKTMVAIKLIKDFADCEYNSIKVAREIQIMRSLCEVSKTSRAVCPVLYDLVYASDQKLNKDGKEEIRHNIFIIMEYLESDIKKLVNMGRQSQFQQDHLILTFYNILCAVKNLHAANIVHRDLKPGNILIDDECNIRLCDFGIARSLPDSCIGQGSGSSKRIRDSIGQQNLTEKYTPE
jgi:serine/threonine protein kinase